MPTETADAERRRLESLGREALQSWQLARLNKLLTTVRADNAFYAAKLRDAPERLDRLSDLRRLPMTTKDELLPAAHEASSRNRTFPVEAYTRFHQTSGTRGRPMTVLDTPADWAWWLRCWQHVLDAAEVTTSDRALLAFSFGPFIGFWSAFDSLAERGVLTVPAGGMSSAARIDLLERSAATVLLCTPTYALHLAEAAKGQGVRTAELPICRVIVAGEPGGSVPAVRQRIEQAWGARVIDHAGATEVGAWGYGDHAGRGLRLIESEFVAEFFDAETGESVDHRSEQPPEGRLCHMVLSTLGRLGAPVVRYRTGDLVRPRWDVEGSNRFVFLDGGVVARADDMMIIRGVNVYPSAIDQILHGFPEVVEYRMTAQRRGELDELVIEVEDQLELPERIAKELDLRLGLKVVVQLVPPLSLPRSEYKGNRFVDRRQETGNGG